MTVARADEMSASNERDYQAFSEALSASARGRAFLAEYTRRNRNADTEQLLAAIERLQSLTIARPPPEAADPVKQELYALLDEIALAQRDLEARIVATRAEKLAELVALVERRISNILASLRPDPAPAIEVAAPTADLPTEPVEEPERTHLAVVPLPEQPELPIPSPISTQPPAISLVRSDTMMAEVAFVGPSAPPVPQPAIEPEPEKPGEEALTAKLAPAPAPANPLASIMALSEEERLALFT
jgi:hypothetical protein